MNVHVQFFSYLKDAVGHAEEDLVLGQGATTGDAMAMLCERHRKLADCRRNILIAVGLEWVGQDTELKEGDMISLMPPVQGG